jgi:hypothetical protein
LSGSNGGWFASNSMACLQTIFETAEFDPAKKSHFKRIFQ